MAPIYLGALDIGGTKLAATVANVSGPLARVVAPTARSGSERAVGEQAIALLEQACAHAGIDARRIARLGVSSCGPFVAAGGSIALVTPNLCGGLSGAADLPNDWTRIPLEAVLRERFADVVIRNDCIAALTGERSFGALQEEADCVYVTWSTGIGFGLCVDGHILLGKHGNAGHAGHMLLSGQSDALCGCGNRGDVEALVSGRNLGLRGGQGAAAIFAAARQGVAAERLLVEQAAHWFGKALYNLAATLDTRVFVIGGSVWMHHGDWLEALVRHEIASRLPALTAGVELKPAALGALVADIGALCLVLPSEWRRAWRQSQPWQALAG
ncbi:ROK family protein [Noviherbaspirillum sedimenti]|nr:ROK family protein [Noviherbaspirillum sedimenti]